MGFYEDIAEQYDQITGQAVRAAPAEAFLKELRRRHPFATALDVACGTGLHVEILARMGVAATGADISPAMLDKARQRFAAAGVDAPLIAAPMQEIASRAEGPFDLVLCLGNSLPHLLENADLDAALTGFAELLADDGLLVLQLLNYSRVLARAERVVGITRRDETQYVRFYDFLAGLVRLNLLEIAWDGESCKHEITSTLLRPYAAEELTAALRRAGFDEPRLLTGMDFHPFDERESDTLMVLA